ncbi:HAD-IIIA family hydrolase [bacterium]|nr:HAD-IIIA family hydrolase [bacterium]
MKNKAVFLDRDGNINKDVGYPDSFDMIEIYQYSFEAIRKLNKAGLKAVIVTNQSGIGRGLIKEEQLHQIHRKMKQAFVQHDAYFDKIYYCPHYLSSKFPEYDKDCNCRKPKPGLALKAAADLDIDTSRSYMIGDKVEDILFGINISASPILVLTGYGKKSLKTLREKKIVPAYVAQDLLEAVNWILDREQAGK